MTCTASGSAQTQCQARLYNARDSFLPDVDGRRSTDRSFGCMSDFIITSLRASSAARPAFALMGTRSHRISLLRLSRLDLKGEINAG